MKPLVINLLLVAFFSLSAAFSMAQNNVLTRSGNNQKLDSLAVRLNRLYQLSKTEWDAVNRERQFVDGGTTSWSTFLQDTDIWWSSAQETSGRTVGSSVFDIGLKWSSEVTHNFRTGISDHEDVFFRSRIATGLDWVMLGEGSWKRRRDERRLIANQMKRDSLRNLPASTLHVQYRQTEIITEIFDNYRLAVLGHLVNLRREAVSFQQAMMENGLADNASVLRRQQAYEQASRWMDYIRSSMPIETVSDVKQKQYTALAVIDPDIPSLEQWLSNAGSERQRELLAIERAIQDEEIKRYGRDQISLRTKVRYNYFTNPGEQNRGFASLGASLSVPIRWGDTAREGRLAQQQQQREEQLKMEVENRQFQLKNLYREMQQQQWRLKTALDQAVHTEARMMKELDVQVAAAREVSPTGFVELADSWLTSLLDVVEQRELLALQYIRFLALNGTEQ